MCRVHGPFSPCRCDYARALTALALLLGVGCSSLPSVLSADDCSAQIVALEGRRNAEILAACAGQSFTECPYVDEIDARYDPLIAEQIQCR